MYSGRLRGGSKLYRQRFGAMSAAVHAAEGDVDLLNQLEPVSTSIAVMGQVKAGKSSLINALLKEQKASTSILPETRRVAKYETTLPGSDKRLVLLDTPGYSEADVSSQQRNEVRKAVEMADIVLLVLSAASPARQSDVQMLRDLADHYRQRRHLKPPPILAVLTHIDELRPIREWQPPYDWRHPSSAKEDSMAAAVEYARELFGDAVADFACVYTGQTHEPDSSVADEVVPLLVKHLDQGHSAAVLKTFYKQLSKRRLEQVTGQLWNLVRQVSGI